MDESLIPDDLCDDAIDLTVMADLKGLRYLVPYKGKLNQYTVKKGISMYIKQNRNNQEKLAKVQVVENDHIIYIDWNMYKLYEEGLSNLNGIEVVLG